MKNKLQDSFQEEEEINTLEKDLEVFQQHYDFKNQTRSLFTSKQKQLLKGECIILDFKENVSLGKAQKETNTSKISILWQQLFIMMALKVK